MTQKLAVVLMNLGGPSQEADIKPFLFNFFMDRNIIGAPKPIRWLIAKWIAFSRGNGAAKDAYAPLGGRSPLLDNTRAQAAALEAALRKEHPGCKVFVSMRYWHPRARETARAVLDYAPDKIVLLPLYPQFSTTTSYSSLEEFYGLFPKLPPLPRKVCCYPVAPGFVRASAALIRAALDGAPAGTRLLFSAHGLPEKVIAGGDPYQYQCEETAKAIVRELDIPGLDWQICYQSRVGPLKWIGPSTEEALEKAAADKVGVVVYPHAFVSEHVETLVEIDQEYRHRAKEMGIPYFAKVPTVGTHPDFIAALADEVGKALADAPAPRFCPPSFNRCCHGETLCKNS